MCTYLQLRGRSLYFRRAIPVELRPTFGGKAEFMFSLRTRIRERKAAHPEHVTELSMA